MALHTGILTNGRFSIRELFPDLTNPPNVEITYFYGQIVDAHGSAAPNVKVSFSVACPPSNYDSTVVVLTAPIDVHTDSSGSFEVELIKGVSYRVIICAVGLHMAFTSPIGADIVNLVELLGFD